MKVDLEKTKYYAKIKKMPHGEHRISVRKKDSQGEFHLYTDYIFGPRWLAVFFAKRMIRSQMKRDEIRAQEEEVVTL